MSWCACARCGEIFSGIRAFDRHQVTAYGTPQPVTCREPAALGMVRNHHGYWTLPVDPEKGPPPWRRPVSLRP